VPWPIGLVVKNEGACDHLRRHSGAGVSNGERNILSCPDIPLGRHIGFVEMRVRRLDRQPASLRHGVPRIDAQIKQRVLELIGVAERGP
jgi:hypothetical protein